MTGVVYLAVGAVMAVALSTVLWLTQRKPRSPQSSIEEFRREMEALSRRPGVAPEDGSPVGPGGRSAGRRRRASASRPTPIVPAAPRGDLARKLRTARQHGGPAAAGRGRGSEATGERPGREG